MYCYLLFVHLVVAHRFVPHTFLSICSAPALYLSALSPSTSTGFGDSTQLLTAQPCFSIRMFPLLGHQDREGQKWRACDGVQRKDASVNTGPTH